MKIHNICIDKSVPSVARYYKDIQEGDENAVFMNDILHEGDIPSLHTGNSARGERRIEMTEAIGAIGVRRPTRAMQNSRA